MVDATGELPSLYGVSQAKKSPFIIDVHSIGSVPQETPTTPAILNILLLFVGTFFPSQV